MAGMPKGDLMSDETAAPSERAMGFLRRLHPVTRLIVAAGVLHLCGDVISVLNVLWLQQNAYTTGQGSIVQMLSNGAHALAYSVSFFGTAATVEYLFRIWREVSLMRRRSETGGGK
jgi:hypothetical protein